MGLELLVILSGAFMVAIDAESHVIKVHDTRSLLKARSPSCSFGSRHHATGCSLSARKGNCDERGIAEARMRGLR